MARRLTLSRLKKLLDYDPSSGIFHWKFIVFRSKMKVGDVAGGLDEKGYVRIRIDGIKYRAHRLAWFYVKGVWPSDTIDHKDRVRNNNRILNLREANGHLQACNRFYKYNLKRIRENESAPWSVE